LQGKGDGLIEADGREAEAGVKIQSEGIEYEKVQTGAKSIDERYAVYRLASIRAAFSCKPFCCRTLPMALWMRFL